VVEEGEKRSLRQSRRASAVNTFWNRQSGGEERVAQEHRLFDGRDIRGESDAAGANISLLKRGGFSGEMQKNLRRVGK